MEPSTVKKFLERQTLPETGKLRILICRTCSIPFASPMAFIAARLRDNQPIHCPAGHVYCDAFKTAEGDAFALNLALTEANADLTEKLHACERELMTFRAQAQAAELSRAELDRRRNLIVGKAARAEYGRKSCMFCGKPFADLLRHLLKHEIEIARLSPADFQ